MSEQVEPQQPDSHSEIVRPMPIRSGADAIWLLRRVHSVPMKRAAIGFALDDDGIGGKVFEFEHPPQHDLLFFVADTLARLGAAQGASSLVLASVRPSASRGHTFLGDVLPGDVDRWLEVNHICDRHGVRLLDWYVIGHGGIQCPRDLLGEPSRWPS